MIALKVFAVFVLCCSLGANAQIKCFQGETTLGLSIPGQSFPTQPASGLISRSCPSDGDYSCARFDIDAEVTAFEGLTQKVSMQQGLCLTSENCTIYTCEFYLKTLESRGLGNLFEIKNCCSYCCTTDNCNNAAATAGNGECSGTGTVAFKAWLMVVTALMALLVVFHS